MNTQLPKASFTQLLIAANRIDPNDFQHWVFREEMRFGATGKWWGDFGQRDFPHEGIDFCLYADSDGRIFRLGDQTRIPVMHDGVVKAVFKDYLGKAVIIEHVSGQDPTDRLLSAYAHTVPVEGIQPGTEVKSGDIIATIADTRTSKAKILPHLHYSIGLPAPDLDYGNFVWNVMRDPDLITLCDPEQIIDWPHKVIHIDLDADLEIRMGIGF